MWRASVRCDEIYQRRGVTAGAGDTERQSPTLDKYSDDASRSRIERARLLFKREGLTRDRPPGDLQLRWTVTTWDCVNVYRYSWLVGVEFNAPLDTI